MTSELVESALAHHRRRFLLALAMIPLSWIPPDRLPAALLVLMPGRYLNFGALTFVALLIGLLGSRRAALEPPGAAFLSCGLLARRPQHAVGVPRTPSQHPLSESRQAAADRLDGRCRAARRRRMEEQRQRAKSKEPSHPSHPLHPLHLSHLLHLFLLSLVVLMTMHQHGELSGAHFHDRTNDVFFADIARGPGVLLVAGDLHLIQLRTRRPVLLDTGALDTVMYSLETGAPMQRMLRDIYGLDLLQSSARRRWCGPDSGALAPRHLGTVLAGTSGARSGAISASRRSSRTRTGRCSCLSRLRAGACCSMTFQALKADILSALQA